jgi:hypothetical protein
METKERTTRGDKQAEIDALLASETGSLVPFIVMVLVLVALILLFVVFDQR